MSSNSTGNCPSPSPSFTELLSLSASPRLSTTINSLPADVLQGIFDIYRLDEVPTPSHLPWKWHRLAHVCRTWRDAIFSSTCHLNLELLCTHGTPVRKSLEYLPVLPLVIHFPGPIKDSDEDNIVAALEHPDRVRVVDLCAPSSMLEKLASVTQGPFPALTRLSLESIKDGTMPIHSYGFLGGSAPRLRKLYLNGIPFPTALNRLLSAHDLIDVDIRDAVDISPEGVVVGLATMSRLKYLTLGFRWGAFHLPSIRQPPSRSVLPALTRFYYIGLFEYLEYFVEQIDAPQLDCFGIEYLEYWDEEEIADYEIPQLCKFIDRSEKLKLSWFRRMDLRIQPNTVVIELVHEGQSSFKLSIQDEGINQVLRQIWPILSNVDRLFISSGDTEYNELGDEILWLQLLRSFTTVKALSVQDRLSQHVVSVLQNVPGERAAEVLPTLELLCLQNWPMACVEKFVEARRNVGRPITFINETRELQERLETSVSGWDNAPYQLPTLL